MSVEALQNPPTRPFASSHSDIVKSFARTRHWMTLAWYDFLLPHRRTLLGPLWQILYVVVWTAGLSLLFYAGDRGGGRTDFVPYLACGVTFFSFMSNTLTRGASLFSRNANFILNTSVPLFFYVLRQCAFNFIELGFKLSVVIAACIYFLGGLSLDAIWFFAGLGTYVITAIWATMLCALVGLRFRDTDYAVSTVMRFMFFMTPVFWHPVPDSLRSLIATYNPFTYFLNITRQPLLGITPDAMNWIVVGTINLVGIVITYALFVRMRDRVPLWL